MKLRTFTHNGSTKIGKLIGEEILDFSIACPDLPTYMVGLLTAGDAALGQARNASERTREAARHFSLGGHDPAVPR